MLKVIMIDSVLLNPDSTRVGCSRTGPAALRQHKRYPALCVFAVAVIAAVPMADGQTRPVKDRLVGAWKLVKWEVYDASGGAPRPGTYDVGQVIYDAGGQMSAHLMNSAMASQKGRTTDADRAAAARLYIGYFGRFTVDEGKRMVVHHVTGSSFPTYVGSQQVRYYNLAADGNSLTLSLKDGERVTQTLYWERIRN
jgi:hypothetical protein